MLLGGGFPVRYAGLLQASSVNLPLDTLGKALIDGNGDPVACNSGDSAGNIRGLGTQHKYFQGQF